MISLGDIEFPERRSRVSSRSFHEINRKSFNRIQIRINWNDFGGPVMRVFLPEIVHKIEEIHKIVDAKEREG